MYFYASIGAFTLANLDWIWTETGTSIGFTACVHIRLVSGLWVKCNVNLQDFGQNIGKTSSEQLFHHSNQPLSSPNSV